MPTTGSTAELGDCCEGSILITRRELLKVGGEEEFYRYILCLIQT